MQFWTKNGLLPLILIWGLSACAPPPSANSSAVAGMVLDTILTVSGRQGVATDGEYLYVSGSKSLYKYTFEGELLEKNLDPFRQLQGPINHLGDIAVFDGELYAGAENFVNGRGENIQILVYDLDSLEVTRSIPWYPASGQMEVCGIAIDAQQRAIWLADWLNGGFLYHYNLDSGEYEGKLKLQPALKQIQGLELLRGDLIITADDGDADSLIHDHLYQVQIPEQYDIQISKPELLKTFHEFKRAGEIEGLCYLPEPGTLYVLMNRGTKIIQGMPQGFYPGYDHEIHEIYVYTVNHKDLE